MQVLAAARIAAVLLVGAAYVLASHWLMVQTEASAWNVVGVLSPMLIVIGVGAWRSGHRALGAGAALALAALCVQASLGIRVTSHALYLLQHVGVNLFLALVFASTLMPGRTSLITTVATKVHRNPLPPAHLAYTRRLTQLWVAFFTVIVVVSLVLFVWTPFDTWAVFANLVTPMATALLFGGEHLLRYRLHPEFERSSVADAISAYMRSGKAAAPRVPQ